MSDKKIHRLLEAFVRVARNNHKPKPKPVDTSALKQPVNTGNTQPKSASK
jgi:hypothetical protein